MYKVGLIITLLVTGAVASENPYDLNKNLKKINLEEDTFIGDISKEKTASEIKEKEFLDYINSGEESPLAKQETNATTTSQTDKVESTKVIKKIQEPKLEKEQPAKAIQNSEKKIKEIDSEIEKVDNKIKKLENSLEKVESGNEVTDKEPKAEESKASTKELEQAKQEVTSGKSAKKSLKVTKEPKPKIETRVEHNATMKQELEEAKQEVMSAKPTKSINKDKAEIKKVDAEIKRLEDNLNKSGTTKPSQDKKIEVPTKSKTDSSSANPIFDKELEQAKQEVASGKSAKKSLKVTKEPKSKIETRVEHNATMMQELEQAKQEVMSAKPTKSINKDKKPAQNLDINSSMEHNSTFYKELQEAKQEVMNINNKKIEKKVDAVTKKPSFEPNSKTAKELKEAIDSVKD